MKISARILLSILIPLLGLWEGPPAPASAQDAPPTGGDGTGDEFVSLPLDSLARAAQEMAAQADSAGAQADSLDLPPPPLRIPTSSNGVHPQFKSSTAAGDQRINLNNSMNVNIAYPNTWTVGGDIRYDRTIPRENQQETLNTGYNLNMGKQLIEGVPLRMTASEKYNRSEQNAGTSNYRRDETNDSQMLISTSGGKDLTDWLGANLSTSVSISKVESKNNQGLDRTASNGMRQFASHVDFKPVSGLKVTTGLSGTVSSGTSELVGIRDNVETSNDSLQLKVDYRVGQKLTISLSGGRKSSDAQRLDFLRDQYNIVDPDSIPVKEGTLDNDYGGDLSVSFKPSRKIDFKFGASGSVSERRVTNSTSKDKDGDSQSMDMSLRLIPWSKQSLNFSYKRSAGRTKDFTADREQEKRELFITSDQGLGDTFKFGGEAFFLISQDFYADPQLNPQDRDQLQTRLAMSVDGKVTRWLSASNSLRWTENRDVLVQSERSIGSKDRRILAWATKVDYNFFKRFKLDQSYEVAVTEEDFIFTRDKNVLDRKYVLITKATVPIYKTIRMDFGHEFRKEERGGYLPDPSVAGHPKTFFKEDREKKEYLRLGISYGYREYLNISIREELGRTVEFDYETEEQTFSSFGTLDFSMRFNKRLNEQGNLGFTLDHKARFGKFVRENQRKLWLPTLSIDYNF